MKKLFLFFIVNICLFFSSCSDDNDKTKSYSPADIAGDWKFNKCEARQVNTNRNEIIELIREDLARIWDPATHTFTTGGEYLKDNVQVGKFTFKENQLIIIPENQDSIVYSFTDDGFYSDGDSTAYYQKILAELIPDTVAGAYVSKVIIRSVYTRYVPGE